jgi:hypothetical protein
MNKVVSVTKRIKTPEGLRYYPVVRNANGRIKQDAVLVNGSEERHPEGSYYISWLEGRKLRRVAIGRDATEAYNAQLRREQELASGIPVNGNGNGNGNGNLSPDGIPARLRARNWKRVRFGGEQFQQRFLRLSSGRVQYDNQHLRRASLL